MWCTLAWMRFSKSHLFLQFLYALLFMMLFSFSRQGMAKTKTRLKAVLVLKIDKEKAENATTVIRGHLTDLPVNLEVAPSKGLPESFDGLYGRFTLLAEKKGAKVVFLIDLSGTDHATLFISLPDTGTTLVRHIDCSDETTDGRYEVVAVIVRGVLAAMTTGGEIGVHIPEVPESPTSSAEAVPDGDPQEEDDDDDDDASTSRKIADEKSDGIYSSITFTARAAYGLGMASEKIPVVHNFRLDLGANLESFRLFVSYRVTMPFGREDDDVMLTLYPHPLGLGLGYRIQFSKGALFVGLEGILDPVSWNVIPQNDRAVEESPHRTLRYAVSPFLLADWQVSHHASFYFAFSLDIYLYQPVYYLTIEGEKSAFMSLWTFSPFFQIGVGFGLGR